MMDFMQQTNSTKPIGVGFLGFGFIGKLHAHAHKAIPLFFDNAPETRLIGVATGHVESAEKAKKQAGFEFATTDISEIINHPDIDLIHICTPNDAHYAAIKLALMAGKHVYCDKPLALSTREAEELATLARTSVGVCRMTFNCRFLPATLRAKELIASGFLGDLYHFRGAYLHAGYIDPNRPRTWRTQMEKSGGGALMDLGVHLIDLLGWLLSTTGEFDRVSAQLITRIGSRPDVYTGEPALVDVDDIAIAQVGMTNGAVGVLEASRLATGVQDELRFELHGSRGMIAFNLMEPNYLTIYDATIPEGVYGGDRGQQRIECVTRFPKPYSLGATKNPIGWPQTHVHCLHDALLAIASGDKASGPNFDDGYKAQRFVAKCQESAQKTGWITVSP
jgi:predicted dehydrogenase